MKINYDMNFDVVYDAIIFMTIAVSALVVIAMITGVTL